MTDDVEAKPAGLIRRIIAFPITLLMIGFPLVAFCAILVGAAFKRMTGYDANSPLNAVDGLLIAIATIYAYKGFKRWIERSPDTEFSWNGWIGELSLGVLIGFGLFSVITGVVALCGGFEVLGWRGLGGFWPMLGIALFSGFLEETLFRGLGLRLLEKVIGTWGALAATSLFFGIGHIGNPNATWFAAIAIAIEAGILLGAAYLLTRRLWMAAGIHAAWNFTQGWVYGIPVSGTDTPLGLLITRRVGPDWLTGGDFGLEASVVALAGATLAGLFMLRKAQNRGDFVGPMWSNQTKL